MAVEIEACRVGVIFRDSFEGIGHFLDGAHNPDFFDRQDEISEFCASRGWFYGFGVHKTN